MIYELRSYTVNPGRMPALQARFRDHTCRLFERHGITNIGYWTNAIGGRTDELLYIVGYPDLGARDGSWAAFRSDPEVRQAVDESEKAGPITHHIKNRILVPTDFSPLR